MDYAYPTYLVANVSISYELHFPWPYYAIIYGIIFGLYFLINRVLVRRIRKMTPAEVLKNRE